MQKEARNIETRVLNSEVRAAVGDDGKKMVWGYAAVFGKESENLGGFIEVIEPGFFRNVLGDDVRALKNHNDDWVLGRTKSGTLRMKEDDKGLYYEYDDPGTTYSEDLLRSIGRGDIDQSSFGFWVADGGEKREIIERDGKRIVKRTLLPGGAEKLYDVSPVTYPAYHDTTVAKRSITAWMEEMENESSNDKTTIVIEQDRLTRALRISELKMKVKR